MLHARKDYNDLKQLEKKIPQEEPVFLIRGQDLAGAETLRFWARKNLEVGGDSELSFLAEAHALRMERWHLHKTADMKHKE